MIQFKKQERFVVLLIENGEVVPSTPLDIRDSETFRKQKGKENIFVAVLAFLFPPLPFT